MGKSNYGIFHSYVSLPEGNLLIIFRKKWFSLLKRATCEDGFLLFIHATEGHQAPQGAVLPTVHPHLGCQEGGEQQEWKHRDIHWINMYKYTGWWFEPL